MKSLGKALPFVSPAYGLFKLLKPKAPPKVLPTPMVTRDDARDAAARGDELRRRRGSGADQVTGARGAEAGSGAATLLG